MKFFCHSALFALFACMTGVSVAAHAEVTVENQLIQSGLFSNASCKPEGIEGFNECACLADIHTPVLQGMADAEKQKQLNASLLTAAEKQKCTGTESQSESKEEPASSTSNFVITYQSPALLALRYENWSYTGGAHGNGSVEGVLVDLTQGKVIALADIFAKAALPELNKYIYDALSAEPEGEVFHDSIEGFKGVFVTDRECKSCTVVLTDEGVKVVFQTYAVASFANGPMEVLVPEKLVASPVLQAALKAPKTPIVTTQPSPESN